MTELHLSDCPFCGSNKATFQGGTYLIECDRCKCIVNLAPAVDPECKTATVSDLRLAIARRWNRRDIPPTDSRYWQHLYEEKKEALEVAEQRIRELETT